jgi:hypothetical protein
MQEQIPDAVIRGIFAFDAHNRMAPDAKKSLASPAPGSSLGAPLHHAT